MATPNKKSLKPSRIPSTEIIKAIADLSTGKAQMNWRVFENGANYIIVKNDLTGERFYAENKYFAQYEQLG